MIITMEGRPGEGKSTLANAICADKNVLHITEDDLNGRLWFCTDNVPDYIVVDNVNNIERVKDWFSSDKIVYHIKFEGKMEAPMPHVIIMKTI